ncbi:hypothetical protein A6P39_041295 [Streptomyces sp. FXJ1.172]|uniref:hypothetical protein n=1 Tax=Streptomyces sp. FXJ1.172 TaxID=710705 RepID=UPI0007CF457C|nr:hypothetical protein [Streptomyces sp. FXJ1.172]WEO99948.1 hypothetical protein A6P39_041295 [Streptomyces sp. FXJ1.172]
MTALESEVVDPQHPWALLRWLGRQGSDAAEQGIRTDLAVQHGREPGPGTPGQEPADHRQHRLLELAAAPVPDGKSLDLLGEGPAWTRRHLAPEPAARQVIRQRTPADGDISEPSPVTVVDTA